MPHQGPPKWDGTYVDIDPIAGKFFPVVLGQPFVISINDSNDLFFTLYTTEEKLKETTGKILAKLDMPNKYTIGTVRETKDFIDLSSTTMGSHIMRMPPSNIASMKSFVSRTVPIVYLFALYDGRKVKGNYWQNSC